VSAPDPVPRPGAGDDAERDRALVPILLLVVLATGMIDAACLLHLGVFTAYLTGSLILFGAHLVGASGSPLPSAVAVGSFVVGAAIGARLLRAAAPDRRPVAAVLGLVAAVVLAGAIAAAVLGIDEHPGDLVTIALLALAMGAQIAVVRHAAVPDLVMAAATVTIFNLVSDSPVGGGTPVRAGRRVGLLAALVAGAAAGAAIARWQSAAAWSAAAAVIAAAAVLAATRRGPVPGDPPGRAEAGRDR
jgi:uncharacterized membrane protein YoaK (UPF0700 family)